jgi:hypothetical protein
MTDTASYSPLRQAEAVAASARTRFLDVLPDSNEPIGSEEA